MKNQIHLLGFVLVLTSALLLGGCAKKTARAVPPAPPSPAAPRATLAANPDTITQGQSTQLSWNATNANDISIAGLGTVSTTGSRSLSPATSTTYTLIAKGAGGSQESTVRVTVNPAPAAASSPDERDLFAKNVKDVFFDFNKSDLRSDQNTTASTDAGFLAQHPDLRVVIEGHCDDRGSEEYNLALGDSRASSLQQTLLAEGVSADRVKVVSYGKEHPFCSQDDETCWQQNRRDHLALQ